MYTSVKSLKVHPLPQPRLGLAPLPPPLSTPPPKKNKGEREEKEKKNPKPKHPPSLQQSETVRAASARGPRVGLDRGLRCAFQKPRRGGERGAGGGQGPARPAARPLAASRVPGRRRGWVRRARAAAHKGWASAFFERLIILGWNSVWRRACLVRWSLLMKRFSHSGQRNCFSPVCVR